MDFKYLNLLLEWSDAIIAASFECSEFGEFRTKLLDVCVCVCVSINVWVYAAATCKWKRLIRNQHILVFSETIHFSIHRDGYIGNAVPADRLIFTFCFVYSVQKLKTLAHTYHISDGILCFAFWTERSLAAHLFSYFYCGTSCAVEILEVKLQPNLPRIDSLGVETDITLHWTRKCFMCDIRFCSFFSHTFQMHWRLQCCIVYRT